METIEKKETKYRDYLYIKKKELSTYRHGDHYMVRKCVKSINGIHNTDQASIGFIPSHIPNSIVRIIGFEVFPHSYYRVRGTYHEMSINNDTLNKNKLLYILNLSELGRKKVLDSNNAIKMLLSKDTVSRDLILKILDDYVLNKYEIK